MGGARAPPAPPPGYATGYTVCSYTVPQYKYHTVLSLHAKTIVTCVRVF